MGSTTDVVTASTIGDWQRQAACLTADPETFYPTGRNPDVGAAIAICHACPVIDACLRHALDHDEQDGIWGGRTPDERRRMAADRARVRDLLPVDPDGVGPRSRFTTWASRPDVIDRPHTSTTARADRRLLRRGA